MKAGLQVALVAYFAMTFGLFLVWRSAVGNGWHPDATVWVALWSYHAGLMVVIGAVAVIGWLMSEDVE